MIKELSLWCAVGDADEDQREDDDGGGDDGGGDDDDGGNLGNDYNYVEMHHSFSCNIIWHPFQISCDIVIITILDVTTGFLILVVVIIITIVIVVVITVHNVWSYMRKHSKPVVQQIQIVCFQWQPR